MPTSREQICVYVSRGRRVTHGVKTATVLALGLVLSARSAFGQARGTLQVSATVVDAQVSTRSLAVVTQALRNTTTRLPVDSIAVIRLERRTEPEHPRVIVTIEYSRN